MQNVQLCPHHVGKGISTYAPANATTPADTHARANADALHPQYCVAGSTSVICKMTIPLRRSPSMDDLVRPAFAFGEQPLGKIKGHDIELYLDVERPYPPVLRRPPYPASLETRKEIEKHINELLDMDAIKKIGHNEIVEITTPVLITWHYGKSRLCGDFRALNSYTKADRYPIPRIPHALDKLAKAKYITKMD
ncbi:hypothetical protein O181_032089 [Austropuccinia psidii MF-1]|uniref:Reverse transcriptase domain-containing protein n=1 Tax=Austropuccinia psidii MF-1 TaxID=1389203 RepID=A0A9Q3CW50_9BASI|nr:hypothetical protein [Austropuccinia psidii MF-1]